MLLTCTSATSFVAGPTSSRRSSSRVSQLSGSTRQTLIFAPHRSAALYQGPPFASWHASCTMICIRLQRERSGPLGHETKPKQVIDRR